MVELDAQISRLVGFTTWRLRCPVSGKMILQTSSAVSATSSSSASHVFGVVCPTHHRQYNSGRFVLVPSKQQRELLLEHEHRNFAMRDDILVRGGCDPGRALLQARYCWKNLCGLPNTPLLKLIDEFEYIPIQAGPFRMHMHNPTPYDPHIFAFDNMEHRASPLLHFRASHIALMVSAEPYL